MKEMGGKDCRNVVGSEKGAGVKTTTAIAATITTTAVTTITTTTTTTTTGTQLAF